MKKEINNQIKEITRLFIQNGNSIEENHSIIENNKIHWDGFTDVAYILKEEKDYETIYDEIRDKKDFNILFLDGAIFQFMYEFDNRGKNIIKHRLAYLPNINAEILENFEKYSEDHYDSVNLFAGIYNKRNIVCPIRFDFDSDVSKYKECNHYYSHCTLANYVTCRIPVSGPITPYRFINFILKNYYNELYKEKYNNKFKCSIRMSNLLTMNERQDLHFYFENALVKIK